MPRVFFTNCLLLCALAAASASASVPGRQNYCVGAFGNYYAEDSFSGGLSGVAMNRDVFDYQNDAYVLAHCASEQFVLVQKTPKNADLFAARRLIVEMIANDREETFQDVVHRMNRAGFIAGIYNSSDDNCICVEEDK